MAAVPSHGYTQEGTPMPLVNTSPGAKSLAFSLPARSWFLMRPQLLTRI
jgi:hypothetical protein